MSYYRVSDEYLASCGIDVKYCDYEEPQEERGKIARGQSSKAGYEQYIDQFMSEIEAWREKVEEESELFEWWWSEPKGTARSKLSKFGIDWWGIHTFAFDSDAEDDDRGCGVHQGLAKWLASHRVPISAFTQRQDRGRGRGPFWIRHSGDWVHLADSVGAKGISYWMNFLPMPLPYFSYDGGYQSLRGICMRTRDPSAVYVFPDGNSGTIKQLETLWNFDENNSKGVTCKAVFLVSNADVILKQFIRLMDQWVDMRVLESQIASSEQLVQSQKVVTVDVDVEMSLDPEEDTVDSDSEIDLPDVIEDIDMGNAPLPDVHSPSKDRLPAIFDIVAHHPDAPRTAAQQLYAGYTQWALDSHASQVLSKTMFYKALNQQFADRKVKSSSIKYVGITVRS